MSRTPKNILYAYLVIPVFMQIRPVDRTIRTTRPDIDVFTVAEVSPPVKRVVKRAVDTVENGDKPLHSYAWTIGEAILNAGQHQVISNIYQP